MHQPHFPAGVRTLNSSEGVHVFLEQSMRIGAFPKEGNQRGTIVIMVLRSGSIGGYYENT